MVAASAYRKQSANPEALLPVMPFQEQQSVSASCSFFYLLAVSGELLFRP